VFASSQVINRDARASLRSRLPHGGRGGGVEGAGGSDSGLSVLSVFHDVDSIMFRFRIGKSADELQPIRERLEEAEVRLGQLEAILDRIDNRIRTIVQGEDGLVTRREVTDALVQQEDHAHHISRELEELRTAVARGIEDVERRENRIKATVGRARKELHEHGLSSPGLEAEYRELQVVDGGGGEGPGLHAMREDVGRSRPDTAGIPGIVTEEDLQQLGG
jgi:hypothetical protein